jgi:2-C-methyl-D-erythritol 2,4-cyclodiphosphate synthase
MAAIGSMGVNVRSGIGYDVHRFADGRRLVLGGIWLPGERGLAGHSDADVVLHAVIDALLGAAALGDIGRHFPPDDPRFADVDSRMLLRETARLLGAEGWRPINVDATIIAERPLLAPHIPAIRASLAKAAGMRLDEVSVKAKTNEGLGSLGAGEGMAALAIALIERS